MSTTITPTSSAVAFSPAVSPFSPLTPGAWDALECSNHSSSNSSSSKEKAKQCDDNSNDSSWMHCDESSLRWVKDDDDDANQSESLPTKESIRSNRIPSITARAQNRTLVQSKASNDRELQLLRGENRRLKKDVFRLRLEAREKDALINILESQIVALVVGEDSNDGEDDDEIDSVMDSRRCSSSNKNRTLSVSSSSSFLIRPPKRSAVELKHPPAPTSRKPICMTSRKACFQKSTAAIKALPRELSISNRSERLLDDEDENECKTEQHLKQRQQHQQQENPPKPLSETYTVTEMEFIDAFNARGIYTGTVQRSTQMPHGKGKMVYHRGGRVGGRYYDGDWHHGHWHGSGILRDASGDIYEGQLVNDMREGIGTLQFTDGRIFQGTFKEDEPFKGTMSYIDGAQYEGELHHGNRHGKGVYRFSDGSYYEGHSVMNLFEGFGKMTWSDGGWYEGDWSRGEIHGFGKEYRPDGSLRHDGKWIKGVPIRIQPPCR